MKTKIFSSIQTFWGEEASSAAKSSAEKLEEEVNTWFATTEAKHGTIHSMQTDSSVSAGVNSTYPCTLLRTTTVYYTPNKPDDV